MSRPLKKGGDENAKTKFKHTQIILVPKYSSRSNLENAYPHLMFSITNKKVMCV